MLPPKSEIDRKRDSAGSARIPEGFGKIVGMKSTADRLYFIAENGISSAVAADQIDPGRTNINIPQFVQQRELEYGATCPFVRGTICVAAELLEPTYLPDGVDHDKAFSLALSAARELSAVADVVKELKEHEGSVRAGLEDGSVTMAHLPHTPNLRGKVDQSIAHLRSVQVGIMELATLFFPKARPNDPWDKACREAIVAPLENDDPFVAYFDEVISRVGSLGDHRNALIHPNSDKSVERRDYELTAAGVLIAPTIEIKHPHSPIPRMDLIQYLSDMATLTTSLFEGMLIMLCDRAPREDHPIFLWNVVELPKGEHRNGSHFMWQARIKDGVPFPPAQEQVT